MNWNSSMKGEYKSFNMSFYDSVNLVNSDHWNQVVKEDNIFLSINYLRSLEQTLSDSIQFRYIIFYCDQYTPVGVLVVQILDFIDKHRKYDEHLCVLGNKIKHKLLKAHDIKVMVCGNVFACGENGFKFIQGTDIELAYVNLTRALYRLRRAEKVNNRISMMLIKEFWPSSFHQLTPFVSDDYREFKIDVNMVLKIHESWETMDDYLASMKAKFRTKANAAFKKSAPLIVEDLSVADIRKHKPAIEELYKSVVENADFRFGELNGEAFAALKENLKENFVFKGYFLEDKMVGFSTAYCNNGAVDAGYVGINYDYNQDYALYQRILYDYVEFAVACKVKEMRFGRTAEEIKSTLGAEPVDMKLFVKHRNVVSNKLIKPIVTSIVPSDFEIRNPFKADFVAG